jgi:hypothetical protein
MYNSCYCAVAATSTMITSIALVATTTIIIINIITATSPRQVIEATSMEQSPTCLFSPEIHHIS